MGTEAPVQNGLSVAALPLIDIFCDESCHLEHDGQPSMSLGAISLPHASARRVSLALRELKSRHGLSPDFELKWSKVSPAKLPFYLDVVAYFFNEPALSFRGLVATQKDQLNHGAFGQDHDTWYHKMYFQMLRFVLDRSHRFRIYIDIKDTRGGPKSRVLQDILAHDVHDFDEEIVERIQILRSHEVQPLQLADFFVGALSSASRGTAHSEAKRAVIEAIEVRIRSSLTKSTALGERKFNVFYWTPQARG
jgi:hypothetical protein